MDVEDLQFSFPNKDFSKVSYYLGFYITRNRNVTATFDQRRYAQTVPDHLDFRKPSVIAVSPGTAPLSKVDATELHADIQQIDDIS